MVHLAIWVIFLAKTIGLLTSADSQSLFSDPDRPSSIFEDRKPRRAKKVGDILTVLITENTSASNRSNTETKKENTTGINSKNGTGPLKFIPGFGLTSNATTEYMGEGATVRTQQLDARISVTVVGVKVNGDLLVEGNRTVEINGEKEVIYLSGAINPMIIPATNIIESFRISNLQISYKGKGVLNEAMRPGLFVRLLNWIF